MCQFRESTEALKIQRVKYFPFFFSCIFSIWASYFMIKSLDPEWCPLYLLLHIFLLSKEEEREEVAPIGFCLYLTGKNTTAWLPHAKRRMNVISSR